MTIFASCSKAASSSGPSSSMSPSSIAVACPSEYHLHVDADRDGRVDSDRSGIDKWEWGAGKKGAIILCNNDDADRAKRCDHEDNVINGAPDPEDIAPLVIRRVVGTSVAPGSWQASLQVSSKAAQYIRIFARRASGEAEIIGPSAGHKYDFPDLNFDEREFGIEALTYPTKDFDGLIEIKFRIEKGSEGKQTERAVMRVAPWLASHHRLKTVKVFVVETGDNVEFLNDLDGQTALAGVPAAQRATGRYGVDRWMQDALELGYSTLPKRGTPMDWHLPVVLRTANDRESMDWGPLDQYPLEELLAPGFGFTQALPPTYGTSMDSFGNLECSPPVTHSRKKKEYKFGRIIYGMNSASALDNMQPLVREFLHAQKVQDPFWIETGWLRVGHVDEVISFCPMKNAPKQFKVLIASPQRALDLLSDLQKKGHGSARMFQGITDNGPLGLTASMSNYPLATPDAILSDKPFNAVQKTVKGHIKKIRKKLAKELDLADSDFIELPVLFTEAGSPDKFIAYTPGVVNMLVLTKADGTVRLCIPKPFGPRIMVGTELKCQFEEAIKESLGPIADTGVELEFIDDFCTYHVAKGEIHCGTNSLREPPIDRWWWEQDV